MNALELEPVKKLFTLVVDPLIRLLFAAAILYFVYGVFKFIKDKASGESADIAQGANHVLWSTIGIFIMISVWGIIAILRSTIGVQ
ncbi:MAG: hypothetical protein Q7R72_02095 [bacterium]|nr:hypothetical protein [bacterium]